MSMEELSASYDAANDAYHENPNDETFAARKAAADALVAARVEERVAREAAEVALTDGEGVARPAPVESTTEVS